MVKEEMTDKEFLRHLKHQGELMTHLHGVKVGQPYVDAYERAKELVHTVGPVTNELTR